MTMLSLRLKMFPVSMLALALLGLPLKNVQASPMVIWDQTVDALGGVPGGVYSNTSTSQNFSDRAFFDNDVLLTGVDIYTQALPNSPLFGEVGTPVVIRIRRGARDAPALELSSTISVRDTDGAPPGSVPNGTIGDSFVRVHAELANPVLLEGGGVEHWIGMSRLDGELGQAFFFGTGGALDGIVAEYEHLTLQPPNPIGDQQFRLWGVPIPEPVTVALLGLGLIGVSLSGKCRQH